MFRPSREPSRSVEPSASRSPLGPGLGTSPRADGAKRRLVVSNKMLNNYWFYAIISIVIVLVYYGAGLAFYMLYEDFTFTETFYFLTQTITTVGYNRVRPTDNVSRLVTCVFIVVGVFAIAGIFAELMFQIFCVHRDRAIREALEAKDATGRLDGVNAALAMSDRQISLKLWATVWMTVEVVVLVGVGVGLIYTVEDWDVVVSIYWATTTLFTVGYGDFYPKTTAGTWVATVYMLSGIFILFNIIANFATLPTMIHKRTSDRIILSQYDPTIDAVFERGKDPTAALAEKLRAANMSFSGSRDGDALAAVFGNALVSASDENLAFLEDLISHDTDITRDEFSLWLLYLLGRVDSTDIQVARDVFEALRESTGATRAIAFEHLTHFPTPRAAGL